MTGSVIHWSPPDPAKDRLEQLAGDRRGQHSIRVNAQWRLCFVWIDGGAEDVELVDYH
nr:type II toxin-antitoxin system RelE/ParE family toxin [Microbacterium amylolyticum]